MVSAAPPPERFVAQRARMVVSSDAPQTRTVPEGRSERRAQGAHGYCPANMTLSLCYLPWRGSARTRRRAACTTAISALSRRSCSRYSRTASGCAAFHRSGSNSSVLDVPRSMCVMTLSKYIATSRSCRRALATSDIKLALRIPARRDPMNRKNSGTVPEFCSNKKSR